MNKSGCRLHRKKLVRKQLNLDKIRLYCLLHNVNHFMDVPQCDNCRYHNQPATYVGVVFSSSKDYHKFTYEIDEWWHHGCAKWRHE